jgi:hypothetical protein
VPVDGGALKLANASGMFPSAGVWAGTYTLEIDYGATVAGCVQMYHGPMPLLSSCLALPPEFANPKVLSIGLGNVAGPLGKTGSVNLEFDNVTFNIK